MLGRTFSSPNLKVAIIHDWFTVYGGAERVLEQIIRCFPNADLYSTIDFVPKEQRAFLQDRPIFTSFIQRLPLAAKLYRLYLPLMPAAIERWDLRDYDLVISSSYAVAKGVLTTPEQLHICYLQARNLKYAYEDRFLYPGNTLVRLLQDFFLSNLRVWDSIASKRPDITIANSEYVRRWHCKRHHTDCSVIYPPVDLDVFKFDPTIQREDYYVTTSRLEPYKRIDLIVEACSKLGKRLLVIGKGTEEAHLRSIAGKSVEFLGFQEPSKIAEITARARAFIFMSREDFGIAPVEAQACGTPVIALGQGGALETIRGQDHAKPTGFFCREQKTRSLMEAILAFEATSHAIDPRACHEQAMKFGVDSFRQAFQQLVLKAWRAGPGRSDSRVIEVSDGWNGIERRRYIGIERRRQAGIERYSYIGVERRRHMGGLGTVPNLDDKAGVDAVECA